MTSKSQIETWPMEIFLELPESNKVLLYSCVLQFPALHRITFSFPDIVPPDWSRREEHTNGRLLTQDAQMQRGGEILRIFKYAVSTEPAVIRWQDNHQYRYGVGGSTRRPLYFDHFYLLCVHIGFIPPVVPYRLQSTESYITKSYYSLLIPQLCLLKRQSLN